MPTPTLKLDGTGSSPGSAGSRTGSRTGSGGAGSRTHSPLPTASVVPLRALTSPTSEDTERMRAVAAGEDLVGIPPGMAGLQRRWGEIVFLLRSPVNTEEDIHKVVQDSTSALAFLVRLDELSRRVEMRRGAVSRWLLPFHSGTSLADQTVQVRPATAEEALRVGAYGPLLRQVGRAEKGAMAAGARTLRQMVRVKIADDADLDQARRAAVDTANFFRLLSTEAALQGVARSELLAKL